MATFLKVLAILMIAIGLMTTAVGYFFVDANGMPPVMYVILPTQFIIAFGLLYIVKKLKRSGDQLDA